MNADARFSFADRLTEVARSFPSRAALAKAAGLSPSALQSYVEGTEPTRPALVALARAAGVALDWLADGRGSKQDRPQVPDGYAAIPFFDIRAAGGYVYPLLSGGGAEFWYLRLDWFAYPGMQPAKLFIVEAPESTVAEIREGDLLVADQNWMTKFVNPKTDLPSGVHLTSQRARLAVRQVIGASGDIVELVRPGAKSGKDRLHVGDDGFTVHGRVIWHARSVPVPPGTQAHLLSRRKR
jgi:transcriptional regulator with XRE-family HTH domain